jgi:hypothetical protein
MLILTLQCSRIFQYDSPLEVQWDKEHLVKQGITLISFECSSEVICVSVLLKCFVREF